MGFALSDMQLSSNTFSAHSLMPARATGEGEDISPDLAWTNSPEGTKAFAIFCHDPDAPRVSEGGTYGFVHWVLYNIPGDVQQLEEGVSQYTAGTNDYGKLQYNGPMPPNGHGLHQYYFWVLALNEAVELPAGLSLWELLERIEPQLLGMNRLVGQYQRD